MVSHSWLKGHGLGKLKKIGDGQGACRAVVHGAKMDHRLLNFRAELKDTWRSDMQSCVKGLVHKKVLLSILQKATQLRHGIDLETIIQNK